MVKLYTALMGISLGSGSVLCGLPPPAPPTCAYVCVCDAYPYRCHFTLQCPSIIPDPEDPPEEDE